MKKYNVFGLWVIEQDNHKFICERIYGNEYREIFTKTKIITENVERLTKWYSILEVADYETGEPLMLTRKDILIKYIQINEKVKIKNVNVDEYLKSQEDKNSWEILKKVSPEFARQLAQETLQELGIIDENENLVGPYKKILKKERNMEKAVEMYKNYVNDKKDETPDIPIISAKELQKQKKLDKKNN